MTPAQVPAAFAPLSTDPDDFCFIDSETRALPSAQGLDGDVTQVGVDVYARNSYAVMWTFAVGNDPVGIMALDKGFDERLTWELDAPARLKDFHRRAMAGTAWYVAWNMGFDRAIWNAAESDFPRMRVDMSLDAMVQGGSSGLPGRLEHAGRACGLGGKEADGGNLIGVFAPADGETSLTAPGLWKDYKRYGLRDADLLRDVFNMTRALPRQAWEDYWHSERINGRGLAVDIGFARRAAAVADANIARINADLVRQTNGRITRVTQAERIRDWTYDRLDDAEARELMVKSWEPDSEDDLQPAKLTLAKDRIEKLLAYFDAKRQRDGGLDDRDEVTYAVLDHRMYGGSNSPAKYGKMVRMAGPDGVLRGQYTFNGAGQTGRYSSRGVQIHNLMRKNLKGQEAEFMERINDLVLDDA